jgi:hypothetical protein
MRARLVVETGVEAVQPESSRSSRRCVIGHEQPQARLEAYSPRSRSRRHVLAASPWATSSSQEFVRSQVEHPETLDVDGFE